MSSRDDMLARIAEAVRAGAGPADTAGIPRGYRRAGAGAAADDVVDLLADRLVDYKASVTRCGAADVARTVAGVLAGSGSVVVPTGIRADVLAGCRVAGVEVRTDSIAAPLSHAELDTVDIVVTEARVAIAVTGTVVLDGSAGQGRRAISLIPDRHLIVLPVDRIVETVPDGIAGLDPTAPLTLISGPSATSDIELQRVEGVHGPRNLHVVIVAG